MLIINLTVVLCEVLYRWCHSLFSGQLLLAGVEVYHLPIHLLLDWSHPRLPRCGDPGKHKQIWNNLLYQSIYVRCIYFTRRFCTHEKTRHSFVYNRIPVDLAIIIIKHIIIGPIAKLLSLNHGNHAGFFITIMTLDLLSTFGLFNFCRWLFIRIKLHCFNTVEIPSCL